jgi:hypothetical protein
MSSKVLFSFLGVIHWLYICTPRIGNEEKREKKQNKTENGARP